MSDTDSLKPNMRDHLVAAAKSAFGVVPFAGTLLAEIAGEVIPEQRIDRLVRFAGVLEERLTGLNQQFVRSQLGNANFTDLVEEAMRQATRSLSDDRRECIASVVANGLASDSIDLLESKHLLRILGEINDIEVIWLRFFLHPASETDKEFRAKHEAIFRPAEATFGSSQAERDKAALQQSYHEHLAQLGLLRPRYQINGITKATEFDNRTGAPKLIGYEITSLGRLLLRQVGLNAATQH